MNTTYRQLEVGDIIQAGDEFKMNETWVASTAIGIFVANDDFGMRYRRPVAPGYHTKPNGTVVHGLDEHIAYLTRRLEDALSDKVIAEKERDNWQETAEQNARNQEFYHGLVTDIGNMFGLRARITDGGNICEDVLALRVPELVAELIIDHENLR